VTAEATAKPGRSHWKRNVAIVVAVLVAIFATITLASSFFFGIYSIPGPGADVRADVNHCDASNDSCSIILTNDGSSPTSVVACSLNSGGMQSATTVSPKGTIEVGGALTVTCQLAGNPGIPLGTAVFGAVQTSNGAQVGFTGVWE
jgi:hypothetical protein